MTDAMRHAERLAALLDGQVDEQERARLLELLAQSDESFHALVDAAAVRAALDEPAAAGTPAVDAGAPSGRRRERVRGRRGWRAPVALAAGIGAVAVAAALLARAASGPVETNPHTMVALLAPRAADAGVWQAGAWSATRAEEDPLTVRTRTVRIGALLVALDVAVREERLEAGAMVAEVMAHLQDVPAAGPVMSLYGRVLEAPAGAARLELLADGAAAAAGLLPADRLAAGAWLEAARIAASGRDRAFFEQRASRAALMQLLALAPLPDHAAAALARISAATAAPGAWDWSALEADLDAAQRALAS